MTEGNSDVKKEHKYRLSDKKTGEKHLIRENKQEKLNLKLCLLVKN